MTTCYIQLCRYGDIINILPMVWADAQHRLPGLMVHRDYIDLLDGVSYCQPVAWDGEMTDMLGAIEAAKRDYDQVFDTQTYGNRPCQRICTSFARESWRLAGRLHRWHDYPLIFDRRDYQREADLAASLDMLSPSQPVILTCGCGTSSPFPEFATIVAKLRRKVPHARFVSLDQVKAHRLYDLLGLFDRACAVLTIDTAILHLTHAAQIPTFALRSNSPCNGPINLWYGAAPRRHWIGALRYMHAASTAGVETITDALRSEVEIAIARRNPMPDTRHPIPEHPCTT